MATRTVRPIESVRPTDQLGSRDVAKFTALVAFSAIFVDAALGHGLTWENDPYWTYWVTKTFLIATVFGLGTAVAGIGEGRGAVITAVHTLVLTVYYWSLSPVGLPSQPTWLDLEHTWITGVPIHFAVIYAGYLLALWAWRRRPRAQMEREQPAARTALFALATSIVIVVVAGALSSLALTEFPGATWFLVRTLITFPFVYGWWTIAGRDRTSAIVAGVTLAFVWATYGHFLSPSGLPDLPLRIFETSPPGATVEWMSYRELWLVSLSIHITVMVAVMLLASDDRTPLRVGLVIPAVVIALAVGAASFVPDLESPMRTGSVSASGPVEVQPAGAATTSPGTGTVRLNVADSGGRVTPLPPHDVVALTATINAGGHRYDVTSSRAMIDDPLGRHTTWWGVGFDAEHHGRSGIGSSDLPAVESKLAIFAVGRLAVDGRAVDDSVPIHAMTVDGDIAGVGFALDIGDDALTVPGLPGGVLRATWASYNGDLSDDARGYRYGLGALVLAVVLIAFLANRVTGGGPGGGPANGSRRGPSAAKTTRRTTTTRRAKATPR